MRCALSEKNTRKLAALMGRTDVHSAWVRGGWPHGRVQVVFVDGTQQFVNRQTGQPWSGSRKRCRECDGRGWHVGECHPRETCGACDGTGVHDLPHMRRPTDSPADLSRRQLEQLGQAVARHFEPSVRALGGMGDQARALAQQTSAQQRDDVREAQHGYQPAYELGARVLAALRDAGFAVVPAGLECGHCGARADGAA